MSNVVIKNCNNIKEALITIEQGNLNIKFAINGTGKSTIAKALLNKEKDLSLLKPFGKEEIPYVECNPKFNNVELFDSDFVNNVVFNGSNVIENSFEVFIKSDKYDEQRKNINDLLHELKQKIIGSEDLNKLNEQLIKLSSKINYKKEKNTIDSRGMYSSIKSEKNIFNIPKELNKYALFLSDKEKNILWSDWKNKGKTYDYGEICPYCAEKFKQGHKKENEAFNSYYTKANVSNLTEFSNIIDNTKVYLNTENSQKIEKCIRENIPSAEKDLIFTKFMSEVTYLKEKIYNITTFDSYKIEKDDISNLSNILLDLKISYENLEYFNNKTLTKSIDEINSSIDEMIGKISDLQKEIGKMNSLVISKMSSCKKEINSFLKLAGFNYEFDIIKDGDEKNSITILKYVNSEDEKIQVSDIEKHLSWGEKNAFALVLFMYYALSKNPGLIILDDPISSFDGNKKYAIINRLFSNKGDYADSFYNKTVLMLTHDFEPIIDFGINHKPTKETNMWYLKNNDGVIKEQKISIPSDALSTIKFYYNESINEENNIISRICFLRKYLEHISTKKSSEENAYDILSSIIHGDNLRRKIDNEHYENLSITEIKNGEEWIRQFIKSFDSHKILTDNLNNRYILENYKMETNNYKKLQLFRVYLELSDNRDKLKEKNSIVLKFIDEIYHIENDYIFSLDLIKFDIIPDFIINSINEFMSSEVE